MKPIIDIQEIKHLLNSDKIVILDARAGKDAYKNYLEKHIATARFIDLDKDLASIPKDPAKGGRHRLPTLFDFAKTLSDLGVSEQSHVIIYDDKNGANAAARAWWMIKSFGINQVQVLNGGFQQAEIMEMPMSSGAEHVHPTHIKIPEQWHLPLSTIDEVEDSIKFKTATVIDVRDAYRFRGESEPIDLVAGHIPGAINIPFSENLDDEGYFLNPEILKEKYLPVLENSNNNQLIIHCGSGVTACHTILALYQAGFQIPSLYIGSWSEWSRTNREIAREM